MVPDEGIDKLHTPYQISGLSYEALGKVNKT